MIALQIVEAVLALIGAYVAIAFARFHVRELRQGIREGACGRTGHAWRPWLRRCRACGCEEEVPEEERFPLHGRSDGHWWQ